MEPGSLPRLRYGTSYSFRILGVDLAGNSVPQRVIQRELGPQDIAQAQAHLDRLRDDYARRDAASLTESLREPLLQHLRRKTRATAPDGDIEALPEAMRTGDAHADRTLAARWLAGPRRHLDTLGAARAPRAPRRRKEAAPRPDGVRPQRGTTPPEAGRRPCRGRPQLHRRPADLAAAAGRQGRACPCAPATVTGPRPYLRWDPVPFPLLVPRRKLSTGEQLSRLVVRSGLPEDADADAQPTSERHVAPPKATQLEAEAAGRFDAAMGTGNAAQVTSRLYRLALRPRHLPRPAPKPHDPHNGLDQPGIALVSRPGADSGRSVRSRTSPISAAHRWARANTSCTTPTRCACRTCRTRTPTVSPSSSTKLAHRMCFRNPKCCNR